MQGNPSGYRATGLEVLRLVEALVSRFGRHVDDLEQILGPFELSRDRVMALLDFSPDELVQLQELHLFESLLGPLRSSASFFYMVGLAAVGASLLAGSQSGQQAGAEAALKELEVLDREYGFTGPEPALRPTVVHGRLLRSGAAA